MEGGGIVQADALAQIRQANSFPVPRDFLKYRKGTAQRLHAASLAVFGFVIDRRLLRLH
jgi:hypothetical protein